ncbi:MAG: hypothetical protein WBL68_16660 [Nitrososphaeraceae archaeon]
MKSSVRQIKDKTLTEIVKITANVSKKVCIMSLPNQGKNEVYQWIFQTTIPISCYLSVWMQPNFHFGKCQITTFNNCDEK